jgi:hypothetical protein
MNHNPKDILRQISNHGNQTWDSRGATIWYNHWAYQPSHWTCMEDMKGVSSNIHGVMTVNGVGFGSDLAAECQTFDQHQSKI